MTGPKNASAPTEVMEATSESAGRLIESQDTPVDKPRPNYADAIDCPTSCSVVSVDQLKALHACLGQLGVPSDHDSRVAVVSSMIGRHIESTRHLTRRQAASLIEVLHRELDGILS